MTIELDTGEQWITVIVQSPSNDKFHGVYRAEYRKILGILTSLDILYRQYNITQWEVTLGCDGLSALQNVMFKSKDRYTSNG